MKNKTQLIIVGGFLGAGKTTLLYKTIKHLLKQGKRIGIITNDQASELVDTAFLLHTTVNIAEVSGSCFCCNFNDFMGSVQKVNNNSNVDIILAEPVGSCTDLSATILQPLKDKFNEELVLAPLTVLADPFKLKNIIAGGNAGLHRSAAYIYKKQLEESDVILVSKSDLIQNSELELLIRKVKESFPDAEVLSVSAKTGIGLDDWVNLVLKYDKSGQKIIDVDYDTYAEGEAVLGWLNGSVILYGNQVDWEKITTTFLKTLSSKIDESGISVGHIKLILESESDYLTGNITGTSETLSVSGKVNRSDMAKMIINARIESDPEELDRLIKETLGQTTQSTVSVEFGTWNFLSPGYPKPTYRYNKIV